MKRYLAVMLSAMFCVVCFSMYLMLESATLGLPNNRAIDIEENELASIEEKIKEITADLEKNHRLIGMFKEAVQALTHGDMGSLQRLQDSLKGQLGEEMHQGADGTVSKGAGKGGTSKDNNAAPIASVPHVPFNASLVKKHPVSIPSEMCAASQQVPSSADVEMFKSLEQMSFEDVDGGVWKQGYDIRYDTTRWTQEKPLKIFVVPHSHNDPGWIKTFERYYSDQTRHILDNMVDKLEAYPQMRFMYAEMSFFSMWWKDAGPSKRERVKKLVAKGQLEFVTGGWVMSDEANAHYFAIVDQMIEGNTWLQNHVGVTPKSGWAIDPFGHSPTMAYLLKRMGLENMLIQRVHYSVKKYLAQKSSLEFRWRQGWDHDGSTDMFCHMMPFYSYDVPHTCGPDPKICCQFDFKRLPGGRVTCPWKVPPVPITNDNIQHKAEVLLDQYRKKSALFQNNVVLAPLGDDFRYDKPVEWDQQYSNYQKLFDYMNSHKEWNVQAQFGTLSDYFNEIRERAGVETSGNPLGYPSLTGDFYTYSDRADDYWSGYFTSRPFYKRLDRLLEYHLRAGEIIFSLAHAKSRQTEGSAFPWMVLMKHLVLARRSLGLFQHHDGITGTAKDFVMADYGTKMLTAMVSMKDVIRQSAQFLLHEGEHKYSHEMASKHMWDLDEKRATFDSPPERTVIALTTDEKPVVFYNSLSHSRKTLIRVYVDSPHLEVKDSEGQVVMTQVDPFWLDIETVSTSIYKCVFIATVPALGLSRYTIRKVAGAGYNPLNYYASITVYNPGGVPVLDDAFKVRKVSDENFQVQTADLTADFETTKGMLQGVTMNDSGRHVTAKLEFLIYGTRPSKSKSGAYLFLPSGEAQPAQYQKPPIRRIEGPLLTEVQVSIPFVEHIVRFHNSPGIESMAVEIVNNVDIRRENNKELVMRIHTDIQNHNELFSDLNGFQILRRHTQKRLPLQANYFPMPTMAYIQDSDVRLSVLTAQSLGVSSLKQGWLEVMQDRRLNQDDGRGLGQGVVDNKLTPNKFRLLIEARTPGQSTPEQTVGYPSLMGHMISLEMIHPLFVLPPTAGTRVDSSVSAHVQPLTADLPCEVHLLNLRSLEVSDANSEFTPSDVTALLLHRLGVDCSYPSRGLLCKPGDGQVTLSSMFSHVQVKEVEEASLSLVHKKDTLNPSDAITVPPMEIQSYKLKLS